VAWSSIVWLGFGEIRFQVQGTLCTRDGRRGTRLKVVSHWREKRRIEMKGEKEAMEVVMMMITAGWAR